MWRLCNQICQFKTFYVGKLTCRSDSPFLILKCLFSQSQNWPQDKFKRLPGRPWTTSSNTSTSRRRRQVTELILSMTWRETSTETCLSVEEPDCTGFMSIAWNQYSLLYVNAGTHDDWNQHFNGKLKKKTWWQKFQLKLSVLRLKK